MKKILHISDIHASSVVSKGSELNHLRTVVKAILDDKFIIGVDTILITGDITNNGLNDEYELFDKEFLSPLMTFLKINYSRVFICPGNHDVERTKISITIKSALRQTKVLADIDKIMQENIQGSKFSWLENFNNYQARIDKDKSIIATDKYNVRYQHDGIEILSINSSLCSFGEDDKSNLFLNSELYNKSIKLINNDNAQTIIIMHHPIDWLSEEERYRFNTELSKSKTKFLCYGHMHEHSSISESYFNEDAILKLQAGKIDIRDGENKFTGL